MIITVAMIFLGNKLLVFSHKHHGSLYHLQRIPCRQYTTPFLQLKKLDFKTVPGAPRFASCRQRQRGLLGAFTTRMLLQSWLHLHAPHVMMGTHDGARLLCHTLNDFITAKEGGFQGSHTWGKACAEVWMISAWQGGSTPLHAPNQVVAVNVSSMWPVEW